MRPSKHGINRGEYLSRAHEFAARGHRLPHARLTEQQVRDIRRNAEGWPRQKWADFLGVHIRTVEKVCTYETWRHVA